MIRLESADSLILQVSERIRAGVESGELPFSSEDTFRFLFAWELGRILSFPQEYHVDFEWNAYDSLDTEDTFLDLLVYTDPKFKIALEFKLPKSSLVHKTNQTQTRAKILRDISRLSYLVNAGVNSICLGYFLCATNEGPYIAEGRKSKGLQYKTYHGAMYPPGFVIPKAEGPNGINRALPFPKHEIKFEWQGFEQKGAHSDRVGPKGKFAWLKPIKVFA
ncbi:MAG: hypothetical protein ACREIJ_04130 [Nitrospiraceae bacterium]